MLNALRERFLRQARIKFRRARSHFSQTLRRTKAASAAEVGARAFDVICHFGKFGIPLAYHWTSKDHGFSSYQTWAVRAFGVSLLYSDALYPWLLKDSFGAKKWATELKHRYDGLMVAGSALARFVDCRRSNPGEMAQVHQAILNAALSEVESMVYDRDGISLNVTLLVEDGEQTDFLRVISRARQRGQIGRLHRKSDVLAWKAMESGEWKYVEDHIPVGNETFRSIFAMPIVLNRSDGDVPLGAFCIDSAEKRHFSGFERDLAVRMSPYLAILKLTLVCERILADEPAKVTKRRMRRAT